MYCIQSVYLTHLTNFSVDFKCLKTIYMYMYINCNIQMYMYQTVYNKIELYMYEKPPSNEHQLNEHPPQIIIHLKIKL